MLLVFLLKNSNETTAEFNFNIKYQLFCELSITIIKKMPETTAWTWLTTLKLEIK